jgi:MoxR-like ATPase
LLPEKLQEMQQAVTEVHAAGPLLDYVQALIALAENVPIFPTARRRAAAWPLTAAKAWAFMQRRDAVLPGTCRRYCRRRRAPSALGHTHSEAMLRRCWSRWRFRR